MIEPLDPYHLTPAASLNRLRIVDLPGIKLDPGVKGKTGYELVSVHYLAEQMRAYADQLKLPTDMLSGEERELPVLLDQYITTSDPTVRETAQAIARQFGRNLGYILLTLKRADPVNRAARANWDDSYWAHWAQIERYVLGGGLTGGHLRDCLFTGIAAVFAEDNQLSFHPDIHCDAPFSTALPLVGAARYAPSGSRAALIFDFGSSFVKRAIGIYRDNRLTELHCLPPVPTERTEEENPQNLFNFMVKTIVDTWKQVTARGIAPTPSIPISWAAYVDRNGQPCEGQGGGYYHLRKLNDNFQQAFAQTLGEHLSLPIQVRLLHDGSAAATTYAGTPNAAVIMLGTAIGLGFPPPARNLRAISNTLQITYQSS